MSSLKMLSCILCVKLTVTYCRRQRAGFTANADYIIMLVHSGFPVVY